LALADSDVPSEDEMSKPGTPGISNLGILMVDPSIQEPIASPTKVTHAPREILRQLSGTVLPKLHAVLDNERGLAACSSIMSSIIAPALRKRTLYEPS
jgi:hypothetical protein